MSQRTRKRARESERGERARERESVFQRNPELQTFAAAPNGKALRSTEIERARHGRARRERERERERK